MITKAEAKAFIKDEIEMAMTEDYHIYGVDDCDTALEFYLDGVTTNRYRDYVSKLLGISQIEASLIQNQIINGISSQVVSIWSKPFISYDVYNPNDEFEVRDYRNEY